MRISADAERLDTSPAILPGLNLNLWQTLFDNLPDCPSFVKGPDLRYLRVNRSMAQLCGTVPSQMIGKRNSDYFPAQSSAYFEAMDRQVLISQNPISDKLELISGIAGRVWLLFSRLPLVGPDGRSHAVIATARQLNPGRRKNPVYQRMEKAILHIQEHFDKPLDLDRLAQICGVSRSQIGRDFHGLLRQSPRDYLNDYRMMRATSELKSDRPLAEIAQICGYADQSAFGRRFRSIMGLSPGEYRDHMGS